MQLVNGWVLCLGIIRRSIVVSNWAEVNSVEILLTEYFPKRHPFRHLCAKLQNLNNSIKDDPTRIMLDLNQNSKHKKYSLFENQQLSERNNS